MHVTIRTNSGVELSGEIIADNGKTITIRDPRAEFPRRINRTAIASIRVISARTAELIAETTRLAVVAQPKAFDVTNTVTGEVVAAGDTWFEADGIATHLCKTTKQLHTVSRHRHLRSVE